MGEGVRWVAGAVLTPVFPLSIPKGAPVNRDALLFSRRPRPAAALTAHLQRDMFTVAGVDIYKGVINVKMMRGALGIVAGVGLLLAGCEAVGGKAAFEVVGGELGGNSVGFDVTLTVKCTVKNVTDAAMDAAITATLDNRQGGKWSRSDEVNIAAGATETVEIDFTDVALSDVGRDNYLVQCKAETA